MKKILTIFLICFSFLQQQASIVKNHLPKYKNSSSISKIKRVLPYGAGVLTATIAGIYFFWPDKKKNQIMKGTSILIGANPNSKRNSHITPSEDQKADKLDQTNEFNNRIILATDIIRKEIFKEMDVEKLKITEITTELNKYVDTSLKENPSYLKSPYYLSAIENLNTVKKEQINILENKNKKTNSVLNKNPIKEFDSSKVQKSLTNIERGKKLTEMDADIKKSITETDNFESLNKLDIDQLFTPLSSLYAEENIPLRLTLTIKRLKKQKEDKLNILKKETIDKQNQNKREEEINKEQEDLKKKEDLETKSISKTELETKSISKTEKDKDIVEEKIIDDTNGLTAINTIDINEDPEYKRYNELVNHQHPFNGLDYREDIRNAWQEAIKDYTDFIDLFSFEKLNLKKNFEFLKHEKERKEIIEKLFILKNPNIPDNNKNPVFIDLANKINFNIKSIDKKNDPDEFYKKLIEYHKKVEDNLLIEMENIATEEKEKYKIFNKPNLVTTYLFPSQNKLKNKIDEINNSTKYQSLDNNDRKIIQDRITDDMGFFLKEKVANTLNRAKKTAINYLFSFSVINETEDFEQYEKKTKLNEENKNYYNEKKISFENTKAAMVIAKEDDKGIINVIKGMMHNNKEKVEEYFENPMKFLEDAYTSLKDLKNKKMTSKNFTDETKKKEYEDHLNNIIAEKLYVIIFFILPQKEFKNYNQTFEKIWAAMTMSPSIFNRYNILNPETDFLTNCLQYWIVDNEKEVPFFKEVEETIKDQIITDKIKIIFNETFHKEFHLQYISRVLGEYGTLQNDPQLRENKDTIKKYYDLFASTFNNNIKTLIETFLKLKNTNSESIFFNTLTGEDCYPSQSRNIEIVINILNNGREDFKRLNNLNTFVITTYHYLTHSESKTTEEAKNEIETAIFNGIQNIINTELIYLGTAEEEGSHFSADPFSPFKVKKDPAESCYRVLINDSFKKATNRFFIFNTLDTNTTKANIKNYVNSFSFDIFEK